jgi:hypothetical protein
MTELLPAIFNILRVGGRVLAERGRGTLVQVTGGSARRGNPGRGPWRPPRSRPELSFRRKPESCATRASTRRC